MLESYFVECKELIESYLITQPFKYIASLRNCRIDSPQKQELFLQVSFNLCTYFLKKNFSLKKF